MDTFLFSFLKFAFKLYVLQSKERKLTEFAFVQDIKFGPSSSSKKNFAEKELKLTELVFFSNYKMFRPRISSKLEIKLYFVP